MSLRIGIITGSGPQAGIDLWQKILLLNQEAIERERRYGGDADAPHVIVHSVPKIGGPHFVSKLEKSSPEYEPLMKALQDTIILISRDCDVFCICCHTLHFLEAEIQAFVDKLRTDGHEVAQFMSIVATTRDAIIKSGAHKVSIMGSLLSSDVEGKSPYRCMTKIPGVECKAAADKCRQLQQDAIAACKQNGPENPRVLSNMSAVLAELGSLDMLVLACTEFPLIASYCPKTVHAQLFDPTEELARRLLDFKLDTMDIEAV
eukprot:GEMP01010322.1.p1 GENE.GEMP01010322.1~~GEMP01010322.1.p1  ORF type:complete len:261 (+),score=52.20 GEMP01010322.1:59-841(+)